MSFAVSFRKHDITDTDTERSIPIGLPHRQIIALSVMLYVAIDSRALFLKHISFVKTFILPAPCFYCIKNDNMLKNFLILGRKILR